MEKIRIGHFGTLHDHSIGKLDCLRKFPDIFEIVGFVPESEEQYQKIKDIPCYQGLTPMTTDELIKKGIDAGFVEGFELDMPSAAQKLIDNNIPVHMDKPGGSDIDEFEYLLKSAKKKDLPFQMGYMFRYNPAILDCFGKAKRGEMGEVYQVNAIMNTYHDIEKRHWLGKFPGGIMFFLGCHMVDLVYMFLGIPNDMISINKCSGIDGLTNAIDHSITLMDYDKGVSIASATSTEVNGWGRRQLSVCGTKSSFEIKPLEGAESINHYTIGAGANTMGDQHFDLEFEKILGDNRYDAMLMDFASFVRGKKKNPFSYEYDLEVQKLVLNACGMKIDYKKKIEL